MERANAYDALVMQLLSFMGVSNIGCCATRLQSYAVLGFDS